jgi:hypothetical protein
MSTATALPRHWHDVVAGWSTDRQARHAGLVRALEREGFDAARAGELAAEWIVCRDAEHQPRPEEPRTR